MNRNALRRKPKSPLPKPAHRLLDCVQVHAETPSNGGERLTTVAEFSSLGSNHLIHRDVERVADLEVARNVPAGSEFSDRVPLGNRIEEVADRNDLA